MCGYFSATLLSVVTYKSNVVSKHDSEVFYYEFSRYRYPRDRCYSNLNMYWVELMFVQYDLSGLHVIRFYCVVLIAQCDV